MPAYLVANYRVTNPEGYALYTAAVRPTLAAHGAELLVADHATEVMEGGAQPSTIVLKFASKEAAIAWYHSPEYQAIIHHRIDNTDGILVFADGFAMP